MPIFIIAPVAVAGYMRYKKQKAEREAQEKLEAEQSTGEDRADDIGSSSCHGSDMPASRPKAPQNENKPLGPIGKFRLFCENLEKEVQKAQERKRREVIEVAFNEAQKETSGEEKEGVADSPSIQTESILDYVDTAISEDEIMVEDSTLDQPDSREVVSIGAENCGEMKAKAPEIPSMSSDEFGGQHQILVEAADSTPNRPRIASG
jgi:hypothetical protein